MELKRDYKQTEVGVIPEDWEVKSLGEICLKIQDGTHFSPKPGGNDFLYITSKNIKNGYLNTSNASMIDEEQHRAIYSRCDVKFGDILLTKDGANTGNAAIYNIRVEASLLSSIAFLRFDRQKYNPEYFLQQILSTDGQKRIQDLMSGNAITRLTLEKIKKIRFPFPSYNEQRAIAAALSDVDALLTSLDALIAKKRLMLQGAMQELLTGKRRLPGFSGEWEVKRLGEIGLVDPENLPGNTDPSYSFQYISLEDVDQGILRNVTEMIFLFAPSRARRVVRKNDILISTVRPNLLSHLFINDEVSNMICSTGFSILRCNNSVADPAFIFFHLFAGEIGKQIETLVTGSNYPAINSNDVRFLRIPIPSLSEQRGIADVLSDMDAELHTLEKQRDKTRLLKQGMMQELLTGRTRLV